MIFKHNIVWKSVHNIDKKSIQDEVYNEGEPNNDAAEVDEEGKNGEVRTVVEVESEILETDETEEDKQLDIRLQPVYEILNLSTQETASFREWWRFSYLFDIGKYLYIYMYIFNPLLYFAENSGSHLDHIWITCWLFFKSSFCPQKCLIILIFGCGKCAEMFFSILFLMANLFSFFLQIVRAELVGTVTLIPLPLLPFLFISQNTLNDLQF